MSDVLLVFNSYSVLKYGDNIPSVLKNVVFFCLPSVRPAENTYESFDYEVLLSLNTEKLDGSLQWLQAIANGPQQWSSTQIPESPSRNGCMGEN
ncbi:hypothetical protein [Xanthocytophaga agilis]|uniref:Uncharacterized protein n=1 Tax=Xanthocytophaga agilis TaxID=3048010 RepID=A0AAE3UJQ1_9BACT|nr:hypothetical protein [Xanthocytophaga agilis]MDJ1506297.1 hypothetical protein [Xanthocytophaga agilis]